VVLALFRQLLEVQFSTLVVGVETATRLLQLASEQPGAEMQGTQIHLSLVKAVWLILAEVAVRGLVKVLHLCLLAQAALAS
jgi:hypothetical protein